MLKTALGPLREVAARHHTQQPERSWRFWCMIVKRPGVRASLPRTARERCEGSKRQHEPLKSNLAQGPCVDLWRELLKAHHTHSHFTVRWMPAHCTQAELAAREGPPAEGAGAPRDVVQGQAAAWRHCPSYTGVRVTGNTELIP